MMGKRNPDVNMALGYEIDCTQAVYHPPSRTVLICIGPREESKIPIRRFLPCEVFLTLFFDFNVKKDQSMRPEGGVFLDPVVIARGLPVIGKKDERDGLAEIIELETTSTHGIHNASIVDDPGGDF